MHTKRKILIGLSGTLIVLLLGGAFFVRHLIIRSFPEYQATIETGQVQSHIRIYRDDYGVPQIVADSEEDVFFALGVVHAQDRLWQMELMRRTGTGRLSEILGPDALPYDRLFRTLNIRKYAEQSLEKISPELRALLDRYADGVNFIIEQQRGKYPVEFDILQFEPEPWTASHSLLIGKLMAWELSLSWWADVMMGQLVENLDFDLAIKIMPGYPADAPVVIPRELMRYRFAETLREFREIDARYRIIAGIDGPAAGSNGWVVGPRKSESGKPILACDPHLALSVPARWYEVRIHAEATGLDVMGMTIAGAPGVIMGRNRAIAWGMTNLMADDADFYLERIDSTDGLFYLVDNSRRELVSRIETIPVKDSDPYEFTVYETHRGPLVQSVLGKERGIWSSQPISIRWTGLEPGTEIEAVYRLNKASDYSGFREALSYFHSPGLNFIYADTSGRIGYRPAAKLPIRPRGNPTLPFPGWDSSYDWSSYVAYDRLPELVDPPTGIIASANNKIVSDDYPYYITSLWEHPSRIERINEMLAENETHSIADFRRFQTDFISPHARTVVPFILDTYSEQRIADPNLDRAINYLRNWDYYMGPDDVPAAIFNVFYTMLLRNTFIPRMGEQLFNEYVVIPNISLRVMEELLRDPQSEWFEDPSTPAPENRSSVIRKSMDDALRQLTELLGDDMRTWQWGKLHTVTFKHLFGDRAPLGKVMNIGPYPVGGSNTTVNYGGFRLYDPFDTRFGPSMRFIVDMADPRIAYTILPTGQSGHPLHRHYSDQTPLWLDGRYKISAMHIDGNAPYRMYELRPQE